MVEIILEWKKKVVLSGREGNLALFINLAILELILNFEMAVQ